jgi:hypothetical protein
VLVTIVRAGGLASFVRRTELDSAALPADAAALLRELVVRLEQDRPPSAAREPDELAYDLVVADEEMTWMVRATEQSLSEDERLLIAFVDGRSEHVDSVEPL